MKTLSIKYWQTKSKNISKNYPLLSSRPHPREAGLVQHINKLKENKTYDHFIRCQKSFDKIQHLFMIKVLETGRIQRSYLNKIKTIYSKLTANIKLNGEKLKQFQ